MNNEQIEKDIQNLEQQLNELTQTKEFVKSFADSLWRCGRSLDNDNKSNETTFNNIDDFNSYVQKVIDPKLQNIKKDDSFLYETKGEVISGVNEINSQMQQKGTKVLDNGVKNEFKNKFISIAQTVYDEDKSIGKQIDNLQSKLNDIKVDFSKYYPTPLTEDEIFQMQYVPIENNSMDDLSTEDLEEIFGYREELPQKEEKMLIDVDIANELPQKEEKLLIDVDFINDLLSYSKENEDSLSKEDIDNINALFSLLKLDERLNSGIKDIIEVKRDLIDDVNIDVNVDSKDNSSQSNIENEVSDAKESLNNSLKSIKETKKETSSLLGNIANALRDGGDFLDQLDILKNLNVKSSLEAICGNLQKNILNLDKAINCMNDISVKVKTVQQDVKNLENALKGEDVSRLKVEPSEKFVKPLVVIQHTLIKFEEMHSQKIEKVTDNTLEKLSIREKLEKNKHIINSDVNEPNKGEIVTNNQPTFDDNCNKLATDITLFLQNTSFSAGTIEEIKDKLSYGDTESIKDCLFDATKDANNSIIQNIDKFELENYPKEILISSNQQLFLIEKADSEVNFKIFDNDLNVLSNNSIESKDNIFKDFSNFTKHELKDLIKDKKCKIRDIDKFKEALATKTQEIKQPKPKKVKENVTI